MSTETTAQDPATEPESEQFAGSRSVQAMLTAFYAGDIPGLSAHLQPDVLVHQSAGLPYSGTFTGVDGFRSMAALINDHVEVENLETRMVDSGDETIIYMDLRFTGRKTGRVTQTSNVEWYRFVDGKVASIDVYYKDAGAVAALIDT